MSPRRRRILHALVAAHAIGVTLLAITTPTGAQAPLAQNVASPDPATVSRDLVAERSIPDLQQALAAGRLTSVQLVDAYLSRINRYDQQGPALNAFITLNPAARATAAALDAERTARGARGPLHGIPIVVKDNYATADLPTTAGAKALAGFLAPRDAFVVQRLRDAGAIVLGKTNLHELAAGITTISSQGGQTRNPYDLSRNPGGSSGGTGAAVAASFGAAGIGTDTCGSVRNPASANNLFGLRPTLGLVSRTGIVPLSHSQDIGGPIARTVTDLAIMLDAMVGPDTADPATADAAAHVPRTYLGAIGDREVGDIRIGILTAMFGNAPEDHEVSAIVRESLAALRDLGADVVDVEIPGLADLLQGTSLIDHEFKYDLLDFLAAYPSAPVHSLAEILQDGRYTPGLEAGMKRREAVAARTTPAYTTALDRSEVARQTVIAAMAQRGLTALAYPTLRRRPAPIGQPQGGSNCQLSATTGLPALAMPAGFTTDGVPIGLELLGNAWGEAPLLKMAYVYEQVMAPRRPPRSTP